MSTDARATTSRGTARQATRRVRVAIAILLLAGACSGTEPAPRAAPESTSHTTVVDRSVPIEDLDPLLTYVARADEPIPAYASSDGDQEDDVVDPASPPDPAIDGFVVLEPYDRSNTRYEIRLADGDSTWVEAVDVTVSTTNVVATAVATQIDSSGGGGGEVTVYEVPEDETTARSIGNPTSAEGRNVAPVTFLVEGPYDPADDWVSVYLPVRPNGSKGFVRADDVDISANDFRVEVALSDHELRVVDGDEVVMTEAIGVGTGNTPTPGGVFYIRSLIASTDPTYGTFAFGLSGFSDVHESFNGGPGDIGIHGTDDPSTVGTEVSNGCIRLEDQAVIRLAELLPEAELEQSDRPRVSTGLGVPVIVEA